LLDLGDRLVEVVGYPRRVDRDARWPAPSARLSTTRLVLGSIRLTVWRHPHRRHLRTVDGSGKSHRRNTLPWQASLWGGSARVIAAARDQPFAELDVVRQPLELVGLHPDSLAPEDPREVGPMGCLSVLPRALIDGLIGSDHRPRRRLDVRNRCRRSDVGGPLRPVRVILDLGCRQRRRTPASVAEKQYVAPVDEHGLMPCGNRHLASAGALIVDIDERQQAGHSSHALIFSARPRQALGLKAFARRCGSAEASLAMSSMKERAVSRPTSRAPGGGWPRP
jgi:hypothetical protein